MLKRFRGYAIAALLTLAAAGAQAAQVPSFTGPAGSNPGVNPLNLGDINAAVGAVNSNVNSSTMGSPLNFRNLLDNGAIDIAQSGTAQANCAGTSGTASRAGYTADRWACIVNVTSQAGKVQVISSSVPAGFNNSLQILRNSGALTQPVCALQEIQTLDAVKLQGQQVVLSGWEQALAGLNTDNGSQTQFVVITGTGTDQGLGTLTASPAITPAWTNVATPLNQTITIGTSWQRYVSSPVSIGSTVTEIAAGVCFTPTATGAGSTDGANITGLQLEVAPPNCVAATTPETTTTALGTCASAFEFRPVTVELSKAFRTFYQLNEVNTNIGIPCFVTGSNTQGCYIKLPVQMRAAPTVGVTAGGFKVIIDGAAATAIVSGAGGTSTPDSALVTLGNTTTAAVHSVTLVGSATTGSITASADF